MVFEPVQSMIKKRARPALIIFCFFLLFREYSTPYYYPYCPSLLPGKSFYGRFRSTCVSGDERSKNRAMNTANSGL